MKLEREEGIGQLSKELFEQGSNLHRPLRAHIDLSVATIQCFGEVVESPDVAVLPEDTFDRHIYSQLSIDTST